MTKASNTSSGFMGTGGEFAVASELLFQGFNASIMSVDTGIDVVAVKNKKTYNVQVKTSTQYNIGLYMFDIRKVSLDKHNFPNVYYIFVLRDDDKNQYVIFPMTEIEKSIKEKYFYFVKSHGKYRVRFKFYKDKLTLGKKNNDISKYLNNWDIIK